MRKLIVAALAFALLPSVSAAQSLESRAKTLTDLLISVSVPVLENYRPIPGLYGKYNAGGTDCFTSIQLVIPAAAAASTGRARREGLSINWEKTGSIYAPAGLAEWVMVTKPPLYGLGNDEVIRFYGGSRRAELLNAMLAMKSACSNPATTGTSSAVQAPGASPPPPA